jgi:3-oxoacyl-[acyl-carrier protein] reductase
MFEALKGKRALITGSGSGIGATIAQLLAEHGARIGIHYRASEEKARQLLKDIRRLGVKAELFQAELTETASAEGLVKDFIREFGGIDILINNAGGIYDYQHYSTVTEKSFDQTYALNVKAPFFLGRIAMESMKANQWGRIINISTTAIKYTGAASLHYVSAKAAMESYTKGFAKDGAKSNVLVNLVRCGVIDSPMHQKIGGYDAESFKNRLALIPLGHSGVPLDIARMTLFLASESGDFITGETFTIAGGD